MTNKPVDIRGYMKRRNAQSALSNSTILELGSLEHILLGVKRRGYNLLPDSSVPLFFAIKMRTNNQLVGNCEFDKDGKLIGYSLVQSSDGKYLSRYLIDSGSSIELTILFLTDLAAL